MPFRRLLVPLRGEGVDEATLRLACLLAHPGKGTIHLLYIIEVPRQFPVDADLPHLTAHGEEVLRRAEEAVHRFKGEATTGLLQCRDAGPAVVQEATEQEADLILLGMPYKRVHGSFSLSNSALYILQHAPCPVLLLRDAPAEGEREVAR